jgi:hypothetical protein
VVVLVASFTGSLVPQADVFYQPVALASLAIASLAIYLKSLLVVVVNLC